MSVGVLILTIFRILDWKIVLEPPVAFADLQVFHVLLQESFSYIWEQFFSPRVNKEDFFLSRNPKWMNLQILIFFQISKNSRYWNKSKELQFISYNYTKKFIDAFNISISPSIIEFTKHQFKYFSKIYRYNNKSGITSEFITAK